MKLFSNKPKMDSKEQFFETIRSEYYRITKGQIHQEIIDTVAKEVTDYYYDQYLRFRMQYPKSIKRYSTFQIKDLDHPTAFEIIIKTLKEKVGNEYEKYAILFLNMSLDEMRQFEKNRAEFYKMY